jgi:hypothetical protein
MNMFMKEKKWQQLMTSTHSHNITKYYGFKQMKSEVIRDLQNRFIEIIHQIMLLKKILCCIVFLQETKRVHEGLRIYDI